MPLDPNSVFTGGCTIVVALIGLRASRHAKRAATNTTPNGHGPLGEAIGVAIEDIKTIDTKVDRLAEWQANHDVTHEFNDLRMEARLTAGSELMRRLEQRLDEAEGKPG